MAPQSNHPINKITTEEIKDSRGNPTIKVTVFADGKSDSFSVPSGASTGAREAHELRDADGRGVRNAIEKLDKIISPALLGQNVLDQKEIDRLLIQLDGTLNKDNLGGNSMIGVSIACAKTAAKISGQKTFEYLRTLAKIKPSRETPYLFMNLINGGKHAQNGLAFQEYLIVPDTQNVSQAVDTGIRVQNTLKEIIKKELGEESTVLGDEGGFAPEIDDIRKPLFYFSQAIEQNNLQDKVRLALDVAASSFFENGIYKVGGEYTSKEELINIYNSLIKEFNLFSIEDPFEQKDFESFARLKEKNENLLTMGDDLTVSNKILLEKAIKNGSINAIIIKPNQIGTLTETLETMRLAGENDIKIIISHRSGETSDDFIADLAYAFGCFGLKAGAPVKPERMLKYERLIKITGDF